MSWVAVGVMVVGAVAKNQGDKKAAKSLQKRMGPSNALEFQLLQARTQAAADLEAMANKLESGDPLSPSEETFLNSVTRQADLEIEKTRRSTMDNTLNAAAGTGFLRAGRTAKVSRDVNIAAETDRNQARITREKDALARAFRRTVELPAQLRQSILTGASSQGQTFIPQPNDLQGFGSIAQSVGQGMAGRNAALSASQKQIDALKLQQGVQAGQGLSPTGGVTAGGTSIQATQVGGLGNTALANLLVQLQGKPN